MRPKTYLHREVLNLHYELPPLTASQAEYAYKRCFSPAGFARKSCIWCSECGNEFSTNDSPLSYGLLGIVCPCCNKKLKVTASRIQKYSPRKEYYTLITTYKGFQILRHFVVSKSCKVGFESNYSCVEVVQLWINKSGTETIIALPTNSFGCCGIYDNWCLHANMEIRNDATIRDKYHIFANCIKREKLLPELKYIKIGRDYYGISPDILFQMLLKYPFVETLIKAREFDLLAYMQYNTKKFAELWPSIKVARKHGLTLTKDEIRDYVDYLDMSAAIGRDIHSPKYLIPTDLHKAHQDVLKLKIKLDAKQDLVKKQKESEKFENEYKNLKVKFFDLIIQDEDIRIHVLQSVKEFVEEGAAMHHCVYSAGYYKKKDVLILSARKGNERIETIEVNLRSFEIIQSRAACNRTSEYHDRIIQLVKNNMNLIRQRVAA